MISIKNEMALIEAGVRQLEQKMQACQKENQRLKAKLRLKNLDRVLTLSQAAEIAGVSKSTVWRWKQADLKQLENGKIMYSDLIEYLALHKPKKALLLGFNPNNFTK